MEFTGTLHQRWKPFNFGLMNSNVTGRQPKMKHAQNVQLKRPRQKWLKKSIASSWKITGEYYATLLSRLHEKLRTERPKLVNKKILFHQDNAPTPIFCNFNGKSAWIRVQTIALSTLFFWFGSFWLLFISKPQDLARGKEIFVCCRGYHRCGWVF